ncbi:hypothetical protein P153DRAFT_432313 [Dothidotthia symphoricarpi CBS 119687]|uniref:Ricin B lectin domain-containing protein n=1 Tax=Dothidotthia symphoricarpi CBS 119687 TaxID=1392245 RepID=A0A6A6A7M8_9PLEO|nr:uncharacterized protein P153DRAFT_432313 [Dothidotthia symphoricarpi CBS 119687]KAF2127869.1 hypothetical protein P153DRAFT_432313 [Dothidotthia symphoricarpi CBS 119687]
MADVNLTAQYVFTNELIGSSKSLASTSLNASIIVVSSSPGDSSLWYFTETDVDDYYRLHTVQKGDYNALDVDNYYGSNSIDLHFYAVQRRSGQYWLLNKQSDGSVKVSNNFTGPDIYLDIDEGSLRPTLRAQDSPGQHWTFNSPDATSTAVDTASATATSATATSVATTTPVPSGTTSSTIPSSTCTSGCSATAAPSSSKRLSKGAIGGIAGGAIVGLILIIGSIWLWHSMRSNRNNTEIRLRSLKPKPIINA